MVLRLGWGLGCARFFAWGFVALIGALIRVCVYVVGSWVGGWFGGWEFECALVC